jgi:S-adenosylmethionine synthetase
MCAVSVAITSICCASSAIRCWTHFSQPIRRARVALETLITTGRVHIAGEVNSTTYVDVAGIVRKRILDIGHDSSTKGFDGA